MINRNYLGHTLICIRKDSIFCEDGFGLILFQPEVGEEVYCFADDGKSKIRLRGYEEQPGKVAENVQRYDTWFNKENFIKKSDFNVNEFKEVKNETKVKEFV